MPCVHTFSQHGHDVKAFQSVNSCRDRRIVKANNLRRLHMSLVYRNIIKFDLASRTMSLQEPDVFSGAHDVDYFDKSGKILLYYLRSLPCQRL